MNHATKHTLLVCFFSVLLQAASAQGWVTRFGEPNIQDFPPYDTITGVINMVESPDGAFYAIASTDRLHHDWLFRVDPSGYPMQPIAFVGTHPQLTELRTKLLLATPDSGCIVVQVQSGWHVSPGYSSTWLTRYSSTGQELWPQITRGIRTSLLWTFPPRDFISRSGGGYYVLYDDSLFTTDTGGYVVSSTALIRGQKLFELPGGDLVFLDSGLLRRATPGGVVAWSVPCTATSLTYHAGYVVGVADSLMLKIDVSNGSTAWSFPHPYVNTSSIAATPSGGFVASCGMRPKNLYPFTGPPHQPGILFESDSSGTILWSRSYPFPYFGMHPVIRTTAGNLVTGGGYISTSGYWGYERIYYAFLATLDSAGHGLLENTSLTWPGDANYNSLVSFLDDAPYVALAFGDTGPARDDTIHSVVPSPWGWSSSFAADWTNAFFSGVNHKHADFTGDGAITVNDLTAYSLLFPSPFAPPGNIIPAWRIAAPATITDLQLVPEHPSVTAGDTIRFYLVAGNAMTFVDSMYALCFTATFPSFLLDTFPGITALASDFGNPSTNLMAASFTAPVPSGATSFDTVFHGLISRMDHLNVYGLADTLAEITMVSDTGISTPQLFNFQFTGHSALTYSEFPVSFNTVSASVIINPAPVSVQDAELPAIRIYPNPASMALHINFDGEGEKRLCVFNAVGRQVTSSVILGNTYSLSTASFANGIYSLQVIQGTKIRSVTFSVSH